VAVRTFRLITEADARQLEPGSTVELEAGGHVTPLARDTLAARRVTVVPAGSIDPALPPDLAPVSPVRSVAIGADHTGLALRTAILTFLRQSALAVSDLGAQSTDAVDYPDVAAAVARAVVRKEADAGILIDGSGLGSAMAANKIRGVRAAMCQSPTLARYAREHIGANVLTLGSTLLTPPEAIEIVKTWIGTAMTEARYVRRLVKVRRLEDGR
jgi:ribose 5-phosphate isomerase B